MGDDVSKDNLEILIIGKAGLNFRYKSEVTLDGEKLLVT
jgi:hypothetical protein